MQWVLDLFEAGGELERAWATLTTVEGAALAYDWRGFWARPDQTLPDDDDWRSFGLCTGRGFGKTRTCAEYVIAEAMAGRAMRIGLFAQNDDTVRDVMVEGDSGLIESSPPWFKARWEKGRVVFPNGAQAFPYSAEAPGTIRGPGFHLTWATEFVAWPIATRDEVWRNVRLTTRLGYARVIWDTTPKRRHPIIKALLARARNTPRLHRVVRGATRANVANLSADAIAEWETEFGGKQEGREELEGELLDDSDGASFRQEWLDASRRDMPGRLERRIIVVDPAISVRKGTDDTGILDMGRGFDGQVYAIEDMSGKIPWETWGELVVTEYFRRRCDCIVVERNRGGDACIANIRACAKDKGIGVISVVGETATRHVQGTIYVKEVVGRDSKSTRAEPVATAVQRGQVSLVNGADLTELEEELTTWEPGPGAQSPNRYDAFVWGVIELTNLLQQDSIQRAGGYLEAQKLLAQATRTHNDPFGGGRRSMSRL